MLSAEDFTLTYSDPTQGGGGGNGRMNTIPGWALGWSQGGTVGLDTGNPFGTGIGTSPNGFPLFLPWIDASFGGPATTGQTAYGPVAVVMPPGGPVLQVTSSDPYVVGPVAGTSASATAASTTTDSTSTWWIIALLVVLFIFLAH